MHRIEGGNNLHQELLADEDAGRTAAAPVYLTYTVASRLTSSTIGGKRLGSLLSKRLIGFGLLHYSLDYALFIG